MTADEPGTPAPAGEHELPPHLARYVEAAAGDGARRYPAPASGHETTPHAAQGRTGAIQADGHVDPAAAARWHQAQTELAGLIREENQAIARDPEATPLLPGGLGPWLEQRVSQLEQAGKSEPGIEPPS